MPVLENERWELFAQALAKGEPATKAFVSAGFKAHRGNAARLRANESVRERVLELQAAAAVRTEITIESICRELDAAVELAKSRGQSSALVAVAQLKSRLAGLLVERSEVVVGSPSDYSDCADMEQLARKMADGMLDGLTNARWLPISSADREHLADMIQNMHAAIQAFVDEVNDRPLIHTGKIESPQRVLTNGKGNS